MSTEESGLLYCGKSNSLFKVEPKIFLFLMSRQRAVKVRERFVTLFFFIMWILFYFSVIYIKKFKISISFL